MAICDLTYLKNITPGNNTFAITVINMFLKDTPTSIEGINQALQDKNWQDLYKHAHKIKPSIEMIGLPKPLTEALIKMNEYSRNETNLEELVNSSNFFIQSMDEIYNDLKEALIELS